ncbi:hypothetical protein ACFOEK_03445 [Litoribrevibacter euphylliae]|uniref:Uncharacterized protein n=1 Tax=Litoribrevibacter euphylliae TaxID=1834034 RepID=A0ABV7HEU3_9GAMM
MKVVRVMCSIQEGSLGQKKIKQLESVMKSTYQAHFGAQYRLVFIWLNIPYEQSYLAGELSTASTVQMPVEDGLPPEQRHPFMSEICAKWQHITGCNKNEIILASSDMTHVNAFYDAMDARFNPALRRKTKRKMLMSLLKGYLRKGYLNTSVNL